MPNSAPQRSLLGPQEEAETYHDLKKHGFFALLTRDPGTKKIQQAPHFLAEMPQAIAGVDRSKDTWISQAEFMRPNRRVVNLSRVGLLFADIDTYNMPWAVDRTPEGLADAMLFHCAEEGLPTPSLILFSGRGLQAKWLLERPIPRQALPRWNACQRHLIKALAPLGADSGAKDASRVLRLVDTVNSKSQEICRVVYVRDGLDGLPQRYNFEHLAVELLPVGREVIEQMRKGRLSRKQLALIQGGRAGRLIGFSGRRLAWHRLEDLRALIIQRGEVKEGLRMRFLFWSLNFLVLSGACNSTTLYYEAAELAKEIDPKWNYRSQELMTLYSKAKAFEAGERVEFNGRRYPSLYTPRNETLIDLFEITTDEQRGLQTIISPGMALERHRKRDEVRRRAAGAQERSTYLQNADVKRTQAQSLQKEGLSFRAIAQQLNISKSAVGRYLIEI